MFVYSLITAGIVAEIFGFGRWRGIFALDNTWIAMDWIQFLLAQGFGC